MRIGFKQSIMNKYHSNVSNVMNTGNCSETAHIKKTQEELKNKKIKTLGSLRVAKIRKDLPISPPASKYLRKFTRKRGSKSSKNLKDLTYSRIKF